MTRHLTPSGRWEVKRAPGDRAGPIRLFHKWGAPAGGFSHLRVKSFRHALRLVDAAESSVCREDLALIDAAAKHIISVPPNAEQKRALQAFVDAMGAACPEGAWCPQ